MKYKTIHYRISGLDYIFIKAPVKMVAGEEVIDLPMGIIDEEIAVKLIEDRVPIRGLEVKFLRKALGYTLKNWAAEFGLSAAGVLKWERSSKTRLSKVNEAAIRSFCAEKLEIEISSEWSSLVANEKTPKKLSLTIKEAA